MVQFERAGAWRNEDREPGRVARRLVDVAEESMDRERTEDDDPARPKAKVWAVILLLGVIGAVMLAGFALILYAILSGFRPQDDTTRPEGKRVFAVRSSARQSMEVGEAPRGSRMAVWSIPRGDQRWPTPMLARVRESGPLSL
jgi:hypothetical protein